MSDTTGTALVITETIRLLPKYDPYANCEGYYFDEYKAKFAVAWIQHYCTMTKGRKFAGKPLVLGWWQIAIVGNLFGWYSEETDLRRYREVLIYVPRKNGKTELMAAIALLLLMIDGEPGAEMYCVASTEKQAKVLFETSKIMVKQKPALDQRLSTFKNSLSFEKTNSFFQPLPAEPDGHHGKNVHIGIVDELHVASEDLVRVLETGTGSREEPIMFYTTTADFDNPSSICNKVHARAKGVCDGSNPDQTMLPAVFELEAGDDWQDPENWKKANPNLGVSIQEDYFIRMCERAKIEKSFLVEFKRLNLNMVVSQSNRWIDMELWDKCKGENNLGDIHNFRGHPDDLEKFKGRPCIAGLDLSSTIDTSALVLIFPEDGMKIICFFWIPEDTAEEKEKTDKVPYKQWADDGYVTMTPGNCIDYSFIRQQVLDVYNVVDLKTLGFDKWNATQLSIDLAENEGIPMKQVIQGYVTMNEACKAIEVDMMKGDMCHGGNPILRWMAKNVMVRSDPTGSIKIDKERSSEKVDGMAALANCYAVHVASIDDTSIYEKRGMLSLGGDDDS